MSVDLMTSRERVHKIRIRHIMEKMLMKLFINIQLILLS